MGVFLSLCEFGWFLRVLIYDLGSICNLSIGCVIVCVGAYDLVVYSLGVLAVHLA